VATVDDRPDSPPAPAGPARRDGWGLGRLALIGAAAGAGWLLAVLADIDLLEGSTGYLTIATALLAVGLYSSTRDISIRELGVGIRTVVLAVTVGVLAKAVLIAGVMYLVFQEPRYAVLGLAVAQIDPLAVAAMTRGSRMSARAKALLAAWASFDDPITVVLTVYGAAWLLERGVDGQGPLAPSGTASDAFGLGIVQNLALAALGLGIWTLCRRVRARNGPRNLDPDRRRPAFDVFEVTILLALLGIAVAYSLALAVALLGLFFRPYLGRVLAATTQAAFLSACFLLGLALADGVYVRAGLLLGVSAFAAQIVVGLVIPARISRRDRAYLALGQQNGITAIILALLLEPNFPGTVGIVAPAILVVALLHATTNGLLDRGWRRGHDGAGRQPTLAEPENR
jgi:NhaP-type Na+/H+ or K+/H+ antiporter